MNPIQVINEFLSNGFLNVDITEVYEAVNELSKRVPDGEMGGYLRNKLNDIQNVARTVWALRNDKYWESFFEESDKRKPESGWIPTSKSLPKEDGRYLVQMRNGLIDVLGFASNWEFAWPDLVAAWMPLPERYVPIAEGEKNHEV